MRRRLCPASDSFVVGRWVEGAGDDVGVGLAQLGAVGEANVDRADSVFDYREGNCCDMRGCTDGDRPASQ